MSDDNDTGMEYEVDFSKPYKWTQMQIDAMRKRMKERGYTDKEIEVAMKELTSQ